MVHSNVQLLLAYVKLIRQFTLFPTASVCKIGDLPTVCQKPADTIKCL